MYQALRRKLCCPVAEMTNPRSGSPGVVNIMCQPKLKKLLKASLRAGLSYVPIYGHVG